MALGPCASELTRPNNFWISHGSPFTCRDDGLIGGRQGCSLVPAS